MYLEEDAPVSKIDVRQQRLALIRAYNLILRSRNILSRSGRTDLADLLSEAKGATRKAAFSEGKK